MPAVRAFLQDLFARGVEGSGIEADAIVHPTFTRYCGVTTSTSTPGAALFTVSVDTELVTLPTFTVDSYLLYAIPADQDDLTFLRNPGSFNQLGSFLVKRAGTIQLGSPGTAHNWWRSERKLLASVMSGEQLEIGNRLV